MAEALVSLAVEKLGSLAGEKLGSFVFQQGRLVVCVKREVDKLTSNLTAIKAVLADAETRQVREAAIKDWLEKLMDVVYDIEDVLDNWEAGNLGSEDMPGDEWLERKVRSFLWSLMTWIPCFCCCKPFGLRYDIAKKIKNLNERLDRIAQEKDRYQFIPIEGSPPIERSMTTSMIDIAEVTGREEDINVLVKMLSSEPSDSDGSKFHVLSIVGMGGIGKTTLAQLAFNDDRIKKYTKIWVCVSDPFDETRVAKAILARLQGSIPNVIELEDLFQGVRKSIEKKKFLLVLDDVWEENPSKWNRLKQCLRFGLSGSKVLVTTRKEKIASVMGCSKQNILKMRELSDEKCWLIISKIAFFDRCAAECSNLEELGREISKKCRGLPLAAKFLGGILLSRRTREEWKSILVSKMWAVEDVETHVFAPLSLSYYDLSPALKRCFSFCTIFPKDYEIQKETLIELWMAQGYLKQREGDNLEINGEIYFQNLAMHSFFQDFKYDKYQRITGCKMHDIVHDFAQIVGRNECLGVQVNGPVESITGSLSSKVRHLSLNHIYSTSSFNSFNVTKKLRSLLIGESLYGGLRLTTEDLSRLFSESTHVRSLRVSHGDFEEIPSSISKLVQLRWLDLSGNRELKQLPETLCEVHSLQTLNVSWCYYLEELPLGIGKLINLRHLHNIGGPGRLPKGIAELTGLRTLEEVDVGCDDEDAFSLGDLKNLNQLRGRLQIRNLGASNRHVGEAKQAELKEKEHITSLKLGFASVPHTAGSEELLEALEPSSNLEFLSISSYGGTTFPGWMISLKNLRNVELDCCYNCEHLPPLGKLPCLETLGLWAMSGVKKLGLELFGIETQMGDSKSEISASSSSSSSSSPVVVAFPKLTELEFHGMRSWAEWDDYCDGTSKPRAIIMPSLRSLTIIESLELKALPDYILQNTTLQALSIFRCKLLEERYNKEKGEDWSKVSHISHAKITSIR